MNVARWRLQIEGIAWRGPRVTAKENFIHPYDSSHDSCTRARQSSCDEEKGRFFFFSEDSSSPRVDLKNKSLPEQTVRVQERDGFRYYNAGSLIDDERLGADRARGAEE